MSLPVVLRPEAEHDLAGAHNWHEQQRAGLGKDFLAQVSTALHTLASMPELYGIIWKDVRAFPLRRFTYVVYYRIFTNKIEVLGVLHASRDPALWQSRV